MRMHISHAYSSHQSGGLILMSPVHLPISNLKNTYFISKQLLALKRQSSYLAQPLRQV